MHAGTYRYEGEYSAMVYTSAAQRIVSKWTPDDPPLFMCKGKPH